MKKKILFLLFTMSFFLFSAEKKFSDIKSLKFYVKEESKIENRTVKTEYWISLILPEKMRKEMALPELNRGEIYIYSEGKKTVFLPFFNQTSVEEATAEENRILEFIKDIRDKDIEKTKEFSLKSNERVVVKTTEKAEGYLLPKEITIYLGELPVSNLILSNFQINSNFSEKEFEI